MIPTFVVYGVQDCETSNGYIYTMKTRVLRNLGVRTIPGIVYGNIELHGSVHILHSAVQSLTGPIDLPPFSRVMYFNTFFFFPDTIVLSKHLSDEAFLADSDGELVYASLSSRNASLLAAQSPFDAAKWIRDNLQRLPNTLQIHRLESEA